MDQILRLSDACVCLVCVCICVCICVCVCACDVCKPRSDSSYHTGGLGFSSVSLYPLHLFLSCWCCATPEVFFWKATSHTSHSSRSPPEDGELGCSPGPLSLMLDTPASKSSASKPRTWDQAQEQPSILTFAHTHKQRQLHFRFVRLEQSKLPYRDTTKFGKTALCLSV